MGLPRPRWHIMQSMLALKASTLPFHVFFWLLACHYAQLMLTCPSYISLCATLRCSSRLAFERPQACFTRLLFSVHAARSTLK